MKHSVYKSREELPMYLTVMGCGRPARYFPCQCLRAGAGAELPEAENRDGTHHHSTRQIAGMAG